MVRVPATTANLGPGFDCLGMALDLWNEVQVEVSDGPNVSVEGFGADSLPNNKSNLIYRAMETLFHEAGVDTPGLQVHCINKIPLKRGLGSSAAAIVGGLVAANQLIPLLDPLGCRSISMEKILDLAVNLEGHPDNVAPALMGGLVLVVREEDHLMTTTISVPEDMRAVLLIPEFNIATEEARSVLPDSISRQDAVYNMGRVALLVNALSTQRVEDLMAATKDRLHQPYRGRLFPAMKVIFSGALKAGALGVFLSGSGPTVLALTMGKEMTVAYEMAEAARQASVAAEVKVTKPVARGAYVSMLEVGPSDRLSHDNHSKIRT